jgi:hypothetical protein
MIRCFFGDERDFASDIIIGQVFTGEFIVDGHNRDPSWSNWRGEAVLSIQSIYCFAERLANLRFMHR